jgi:FkbM family methyltransferase
MLSTKNTSEFLKKKLGRDKFRSLKRTLDLLITYKKATYSQFGEDQFLMNYFGNKANGFFVDVGAYHPRQFSNTYLLYKKGWRGINVDATPGSMSLFERLRPRDQNVEFAVSNSNQPITFVNWGTDSENTNNPDQSAAVEKKKGKPVSQVQLVPKTLNQILEMSKAKYQSFDLLSVDVEGWDLQVLQSLDWKTHAPEIVLVEDYSENLNLLLQSPIYKYLASMNYKLIGWYTPTLVFKKSN